MKNMANSYLKKILIVEDDLDFLSILKQALEDESFNIVFAKDGVEGLSLAQKENPDLIILDILMPRMDGIEAAKKMKESNVKSPIIFLTNLGGANSISKALESVKSDLNDFDYIIKTDVHIGQIVTRVKEKLGIK